MNDNIRIDEIAEGLSLKQYVDGFAYGTDAVLISAFADIRPGTTGYELGTGTGIIPILLCRHKKPAHIRAFEIQKDYADLAKENVERCKMSDRIEIIEGDLKEAKKLSPEERAFVISNPPYMKTTSGYLNPNEKKLIARHEVCCDIYDVCRSAASLLKHGGDFYIVYRPDRLPDLICALRAASLEPKRLTLVTARVGKEPSLVLIRAKKGAGAELRLTPMLVLEKEDGSPSEELKKIYEHGVM